MEGEWVMSATEVDDAIERISRDIVHVLDGADDFTLVGVMSGGMPVMERIAQSIAEQTGVVPTTGHVDITLYRDDLYTGLEKPVLGETRLPIALSGCKVVVVDDVLFTGRTVRAALDVLMDYGRPKWVKLAVLVDRGHRELPIAADFTGQVISTGARDRVVVHCPDGVIHGVQIVPAEDQG